MFSIVIHLLKPMQQFVELLSSKRGRHLIVGDFNLPGVNWKNLSASSVGKQQQFMNIFTKRGYRQLVEVPTRGDNILDLVFVDDSTLITGISVEGLFSTSDHCVVLADLYKSWHEEKQKIL